MLNAVESTKPNYKRLLKKIQDSNDNILTLPNFKIIINAVESNKDEDRGPFYQGHKLVNYSRRKRYLFDHAQYIVKKMIVLSSVMATSLVRMQTSISTRTKVTAFGLMLLAFSTATSDKIQVKQKKKVVIDSSNRFKI